MSHSGNKTSTHELAASHGGQHMQEGLNSKTKGRQVFFILIDKNFMEGILAGRQSLNPGIKVRMYLGI